MVAVVRKIKKKNTGNESVKAKIETHPKTIFDIFLEYSFAILLFLTCFIGSFYWAYEEGEAKGMEVANLYGDEEEKDRVIVVVIDGVEQEGVFVSCGSVNCAAIERETRKIFYFPATLGYSFILPEQAMKAPKN